MHLDLLGWIFVGFLAGWASGVVVHRGGPRGCCADILIGILGGIIGGWVATEILHRGPAESFVSAVVVAFLGATFLRLVLGSNESDRHGPRGRGW